MTDLATLHRGRKSFEQRAWADSYRLFEAADREAPLEPEDLERLATAAYLMGREDESEAFWERAHQTFLERGDREGAARSACLARRGTAAAWRHGSRIRLVRESPAHPRRGADRVRRARISVDTRPPFNASCRVIQPPETPSSIRQRRSPADMGIVISHARPVRAAGAP